MPPLISFETGRKHKPNLLFKTTRWSETANGSLVLSEIGTTAARPTHAARNQKEFCTRAPPKRVGRAFALLTKTYHGSRLVGSDLRASHRSWTDYGQLRNNSLAQLSGTRPATAPF